MPLPLYGSGLRTFRTSAGERADRLLVRPADDDPVRDIALARLNLHIHAGGNVLRDLIGKADDEDELLALQLGLVTDATHLHPLGEARSDADHHVVDQPPSRAVKSAAELFVVLANDADLVAVDGNLDVRMDDKRQLALFPLGRDGLAVDGDLGSGGDGKRLFSDYGS